MGLAVDSQARRVFWSDIGDATRGIYGAELSDYTTELVNVQQIVNKGEKDVAIK